MTAYLAIAIGSALGGMLRYAVNHLVTSTSNSLFPWGTLVVNVSGAFLAGLVAAGLEHAGLAAGDLSLLLLVGFCGSYTTVSSFSEQVATLLRGGDSRSAWATVGASVIGVIAAAALGMLVVETVTGP